jgi:hypothetical protein
MVTVVVKKKYNIENKFILCTYKSNRVILRFLNFLQCFLSIFIFTEVNKYTQIG